MLDNIIEKYGLDEINKKTRISKHNLERLLKKEYSSFSKPRALGFISILEREYKEDLTEIKIEIHKWFEDNKRDEKETLSTIPSLDEKKSSRYWIAIIPIITVIIFGFYLYRNEFSNIKLAHEKSITVENRQIVIDNKNDEKAESPQITKKLKSEESEKNSSVKTPVVQLNNLNVASDDKNISSIEKEEDIKSKNIIKKQDENKSISPYVPAENIVIYPNRKMWIGIVNLKNKKRSSRMISKTFVIEPDAERLLITGHGFFSISDVAGTNLKFNGSKKHYFLLKKDVIKEIDLKEFKRLNGGRVW